MRDLLRTLVSMTDVVILHFVQMQGGGWMGGKFKFLIQRVVKRNKMLMLCWLCFKQGLHKHPYTYWVGVWGLILLYPLLSLSLSTNIHRNL